MKDINQLYGFAQSNKRYVYDLKEHDIVPFIGAGLSADIYPTWKMFLLSFELCNVEIQERERLILIGDYEEVASYISSKVGRKKFIEEIKTQFHKGKMEGIQFSEALQLLPKIFNQLIITTNLDLVLEKVWERTGNMFCNDQVIFPNYEDRANNSFNLRKKTLIKLHGSVQEATQNIITKEQYDKAYGGTSDKSVNQNLPLVKLLNQLMISKTLLFLGCSLQADRTLNILSDIGLNDYSKHFAILQSPSDNEERIRFERKLINTYNIHPIWYPENEHEYVGIILSEIANNNQVKMQNYLIKNLEQVRPNDYFPFHLPIKLVNKQIEDEVNILRKSRFFVEFDQVKFALVFARRLIERDFLVGSDEVKCRALAWCVRILSPSEESGKAEEYLQIAKNLGASPEIEIADAFIASQKGDISAALRALVAIDLPISRTAALMIVANHEGSMRVVEWLKTTKIGIRDLDPEGKHFLITKLEDLAQWEDAKKALSELSVDDFNETPVLYPTSARIHLMNTVPSEFRSAVCNQLPFNTKAFPLASDMIAIKDRRIALQHFTKAVEVAQQLNCPNAVITYAEYALWLELKDPERSEKGKQLLIAKLRDPETFLYFVPLGFQFGIKLEPKEVEQEIVRSIALHGGITRETAIARFTLAFVQATPKAVSDYIVEHYDELIEYLDKKSLKIIQIEMLSQAGWVENANEVLECLMGMGLSEIEESRLRNVIAEAEGIDPIESLIKIFRKTDSLNDLMILVDKLESKGKGEWNNLCLFTEILFKRTLFMLDAERFAKALSNVHMNDQLIEFIEAKTDLLEYSNTMKMLYCLSLYNEGALLKARSELEKFSDEQEILNYRTLQINLGIALGDWNSLLAFVDNEYVMKDKRTAQDLISTAQLALDLNSPRAKELIFAAVDKGNDDASILVTAYLLASKAGWESDGKVMHWLQKATTLSGDDGPIQMMALEDILNRKTEWDRRESDILQQLRQGDIPMFLAANSLNKSLIDLMLFPALANSSVSDPRQRSNIPAFSGKSQTTSLVTGKVVCFDATALLTLSFLDLLNEALDAFDLIQVSHSTLVWLFEERQKATFHQPSRIKDAHLVSHLLATDYLEKFVPSTKTNSDLAALVGDELAFLIMEAEKNSENDTQHLVVKSSPVYRLVPLMKEEADLTSHGCVLSSCLSVVNKLRENGQISAREEERAQAYLNLKEKPWPQQPEISNGAILYLDNLAVSSFLHLGILEKLKDAGFRLIVSSNVVIEAKEFISYERNSKKVNNNIENIREAVNLRIESKKIRVGKRFVTDETRNQTIFRHPTIEVLALVDNCDAIIADDRFINQHPDISNGGAHVPIFSTLNLLDTLVSYGSITSDDRFEYRNKLRSAGYFFVSIGDDELESYLGASLIKDNKIIETAELKAIRENVLCIRMNNWFRFPKELPWFDELIKTFLRVLKGLWNTETDFSCTRVQSDWIMDQVDIRSWIHCLSAKIGDDIVKSRWGMHIMLILIPPSTPSQEVREEYWKWVDERFLTPTKEQNPDLYSWIIDRHKEHIAEVVNLEMTRNNKMRSNISIKSSIAQLVLELVPPIIYKTLIDDEDFQAEYGLTADVVITFLDSGVSIQRSDFFDAVREVVSGSSEEDVLDKSGKTWKLSDISGAGELPNLELLCNKERILLPDFAFFSSDKTVRLRALDKVASKANIPAFAHDAWYNILINRALKDDEFDEIFCDFRDTTEHIALSIQSEIKSDHFNISSLIPTSKRYFERLICTYDGSNTIKEYANRKIKPFFDQLSKLRPYDGFLYSLLLSSHSALTAEISVRYLTNAELVRAFEFLEKSGDRISQLGAIEVGLRIFPDTPEIEPTLINLIKQIRDDDICKQSSGFKLLSALFILIDEEFSRTRLFFDDPPFYRRLASLSHAALIYRQFMNLGAESAPFSEWVHKNFGKQFYFQSLVDMRLEPRWNPEYAEASKMKADFFGRIMIAAKDCENNIKDSELYNLVLGTDSRSLKSLCEFPDPFFPGILEGKENCQINIPAEVLEVIELQLSKEEVQPSSFYALVNSILIYKVGTDQVKAAAKAIKVAHYHLAKVETKEQLLSILYGLATVAAASRSHVLADELRVLVRRYRHETQFPITIDEMITIYLVAAASRSEFEDWKIFVGEFLTEMAFDNFESDEGVNLHHSLQCLCDIVPELWVYCGRADAALIAYNASRGLPLNQSQQFIIIDF